MTTKYTHECELSSPCDDYGPAITDVWEDEKGLWAINGEYSSQVNYCPVCGYKAKKQVSAALGEKE